MALEPRYFDALHLRGLIAAQQGQHASAVDWIAQAIDVQPAQAAPHVGMGLALQELERMQEALASFDRALALAPEHAQAHACRGDALLALRRHEEALLSLDQALRLQPTYTHAWLSRSSVLQRLGRLEEALDSCQHALAAQPDDLAALVQRGHVLLDLGRPEEALAGCERAIALKPSQAQGHFHRGNALQALGRLEQALLAYERAIALQPGLVHALSNRGNCLLRLGRVDEAIASYEQALRLKPDFYEVFYNRGNALHLRGRDEEAVASYDQAIALRPDYAEAHSNRGNCLHALGRWQEALASYAQALALRPDYAEALYNQGNCLHEAGRWEEAVASYQQAIACQPGQAAFHYNLGNAFKELNRLSEAIASLDRAIALQPEQAENHWNKSLALLLDGQLQAGWASYEWRWKTTRAGFKPRPFVQPLWLGGEDLRGKTVLLHAEQGLGDTIQFCRYVPRVKALGARVVLELQPPLMKLLASLPGVDQWVEQGQSLPDFDLHCPLLSLPLALGVDLPALRSSKPYLAVDPAKSRAWGSSLGAARAPRVGLVWSGNPLHKNDQRRSLALANLLTRLPAGLEYVSLQKELREGELELLLARGVRHFGPFLEDFSDTAALCQAMDLVLSVDTSVAHLAGALGRPCWVMLPWVPDWRWLLGREDSPWYPSVRLYRQDASRTWAGVLDKVGADLAALRTKPER